MEHMEPATPKPRNQARPNTFLVRDGEGRVREGDRGYTGSWLFMPWQRLGDKVSGAARRVRAQARSSARLIRSLLRRAGGWVRGRISSPVRLIKSLFMATVGKDRGFGFWWLVVTAAIALAIGLLVAALLSPVIGVLAALTVGIWMLIRRNRSSRSRKAARAHLAS